MREGDKKRRSSLGGAVRTVGIVGVLSLVLLEILLRFLGLANPILYQEDPATGYRLKPGQQVRCLGNAVEVNQWGVRDPRALEDKAPGVRRVLVLGDSVTWGGVRERQENLFTSVLERTLPEVEVVNAGVNGYSVAQMTGLYRGHLSGLDPELILVYAVPRDFERPPKVTLAGASVAFPVQKPRLALPVAWQLACLHAHRILGWRWLRPANATILVDGVAPGPENISAHVEALASLASDCAAGTGLVVVLAPTGGVEANASAGPITDALDAAALKWTDLASSGAWPKDPAPDEVFMDDVHLTAAGHALVGASLAELLEPWRNTPLPKVEIEEDIYTYVPPNNGAGPLWSYGNTQIVRAGGRVYVSQMETGEDVPPLCNTRWRLLTRRDSGWELLAEPEGFRQREPCPLAVIGAGVFLNVNDSLEPPGVHYGPCEPHLIRFAMDAPAPLPTPIMPDWRAQPRFTDHSYRGFAADPELERLLMLNIDAETSIQHWCYMTQRGEAIHTGAIEFPIRACYPQVALEPKTAHVLAVGDIVEPVAEWRGYKFEQTQRTWDYVFRALYYAWNPDVANEEFSAPIEIANVDATAGHISNQDLWIAPEGEAYVLYTERQVASSLMRDKFFPHGSTVNSLELAVIKNGGIATRRTVVEGTEAIQPGHARFHETADGRLFAVVYLTGPEAGNYLVQVYPESVPGKDRPDPIRIPVERPFSSYCLASVRAGCVASDIIDILGHAGTPNTLSYARIVIK